jgi:asparagine synthetase B (glutamine-hydrolysing)
LAADTLSAEVSSDSQRATLFPLWVASIAAEPQTTGAFELRGGNASTPSVSNADAACVVLFDGILYNRAQLIVDLGVSPQLNDADVVRSAYHRWGLDLPHRLKGIFALAVVDASARRLLAVRDPLGAYPLFYTEAANRILLSTSPDVIRNQPGVDRSLNRAALADHIGRRWPDLHETFFTAIRRVPPGYMLLRAGGTTSVTRYWDPAPADRPVEWVTEEELNEQFDARFEEAAERALGQGRSGIFLSGGLDSISVSAMAVDVAQRDGKPLPIALSLGFPAGDSNEELEQRGVASKLGLPHEYLPFEEAVPQGQLMSRALDITRVRPAPLLNTWMPAYSELTLRGKRRGVEVILSGAGGDEWLGVTPSVAADLIRAGDVRGFRHLVSSWKRSYNMSLPNVLKCLGWTFGLRPLASAALGQIAPRRWEANRLSRSLRSTLAWVAPDPALKNEINARIRRFLPSPIPSRGHYLQDVRWSLEHPLTALELEEIFEMGRALGVRFLHPYWAPEVADILYRTPPLLLFAGGRSKSVVRKTMARRFPGLALDTQKKRAGTTYFGSVLIREVPELWRRNGDLSAMADLGIVDPRKAAAMATSTIEAAMGNPVRGSTEGLGLVRLWDLMNIESWIRAHS